MLTIIFLMLFVSAKSNLAPQEHLFGIIPNLIFILEPQFIQYNFFIFFSTLSKFHLSITIYYNISLEN